MLKHLSFALAASVAIGSAPAQDSLNVRHLFNWQDPSLPIGDQGLQNRYNEVWGYASNGREYAFIGSTIGLHVFDVTDPVNATLVDAVPGRFGGSGVVHRDYKVYADHLYAVCDQGPSSLQIMDLRYLPDSVHVVYDSNALFNRAHNIQVDTVNARLYTCGGTDQFSVYSIADPAVPVELSNCESDVPGWTGTVGYVHDCFVRDNIVWLNDQDALHVMDFTDPLAPVLLGALTSYPGQGYNHSGWMNDEGTLYAMADETHGSPLKFIEVSDLSDLEVSATVTSGVDPTSVLHNPFFVGDLVHVAYYYDGYWLWDATDHVQPQLLGYYDTNLTPNDDGFRGAWGVYPWLPSGNILVSDMQTGLWILAYDSPTGADQHKAARFRIAPTLTTGPIRVSALAAPIATLEVEIHDAHGRPVRSIRSANASLDLDLATLPDGIYLISVVDGPERYTQRVVKTSMP